MKRWFGQINFEFEAEDEEAALEVLRSCSGGVFQHPAVVYVDDTMPEEDFYYNGTAEQ